MGCVWNEPAGYASCIGPLAKSAAGDAFGSIAQSFGDAADHALKWLWGQMSGATALRVGGQAFSKEVEFTTAIAGAVAVSLFVFQLVQSVLRREPTGLARALRGLAIAFIGSGVAVAVVNLLLGATDALSGGVVEVTTRTTLAHLGAIVLGSGALTASVHGSAALLLLSLACIGAAVVVYGAVVVRKVLIVVTAVFAPVALAGSLADITVSWTRRWIEATIALIFSKLVLVLVFVSGYEILIRNSQSASGPSEGVTQVISGIVVLFLAGFAPWMTLRIVHFTGQRVHQIHSAGTTAVAVAAGGRAAQRAAPYVMRVPATAAEAVVGTGSAAVGTVATSAGTLAAAAGTVAARAGTTGAAAGPAPDSAPGGAPPPDFAGRPHADHANGVGYARIVPAVSAAEGSVESAPAARAARTASASSPTGRSG